MSNPAKRLKRLIHRSLSLRGDTSGKRGIDVFSRLFEVAEDDISRRQYLTTRYMLAARDQVELLKDHLQGEGLLTNETAKPIRLLEECFGLWGQNHDWLNHVLKNFQDSGVQTLLSLFATTMPSDDEQEISDDDLQLIRDSIDELRQKALDTQDSDIIMRFLQRQADIIEEALNMYFIKGRTAFRDAAFRAYESAATVPEEEQRRHPEAVALVRSAWNKVSAAAEFGAQVHALIEGGRWIIDGATKLLGGGS